LLLQFPAYSWVLAKRLAGWLVGWLVGGKSCLSVACLLSRVSLSALGLPISPVRSTSCLILGWGFRRRRIEWTYFRLGSTSGCTKSKMAAAWKISDGHISATGRPIDFAFDPRVGFSGPADRMDLLPVSPNLRWRLLMTSSRNNRCHNFGAKYLGKEAR